MDTSVKKRERERERENPFLSPDFRHISRVQWPVGLTPGGETTHSWSPNRPSVICEGGNLHTNVVLRIISLRWQYAHCWSIGPVCSKITRLLHSAVANRARYLQRYFDRRCTIRRRCRTKGKEKYHTDRYFYVLQKKSQ